MKKILLIAAVAFCAMGCCKKAAKTEGAAEGCPKTECVEKCCQKADSCCQKADSCCKAECPKADSCCVKAECPAPAAE